METPTPQAQAGIESQPTATAQPTSTPAVNPAPVDATVTMETLTTAILEGAPQSEIDRISGELAPQKTEPAPAIATESATAVPGPTPMPEPPVEPEPAPAPAPNPETPASAEPTPTPKPDDLTDTEPGTLPKRIRIESLPDKDRAMVGAALMIAKGENIPFEEAFARVSGRPSAPAATPAQAEPAPTEPNSAELQAKADGIKAKLKEVGESEGLFTPEIADLQQQYSDTVADLKVTKLREHQRTEQAQLTQAQMQNAWDKSLAQATKDFPDMADRNSPQYLLAASLNLRARQDQNHPLHQAVYDDPAAPYKFAEEAAKLLGKSKVQTPPPVAPQVPPQGQSRQVLPAPGSRSTQVQTQPQKTREQILAESEAATLAAIEGAPVSTRSGDLGILIR